MKVKTVVTSYAGGVKNIITQGETHDVTHAEYEEAIDGLKKFVGTATYFELDGTIIPGEFLRNHCVIKLVKVEE